MKPITEKMLTELSKLVKQYSEDEIKGNDIVQHLISMVYENTIVNFYKKFKKKGKSMEEYEDYSNFVISVADSHITTLLHSFSLDVTNGSYKLPLDNIQMLRKQYIKVLMASDREYNTYNELFSSLFCAYYLSPMENAIKNRKFVLEEKQNVISN